MSFNKKIQLLLFTLITYIVLLFFISYIVFFHYHPLLSIRQNIYKRNLLEIESRYRKIIKEVEFFGQEWAGNKQLQKILEKYNKKVYQKRHRLNAKTIAAKKNDIFNPDEIPLLNSNVKNIFLANNQNEIIFNWTDKSQYPAKKSIASGFYLLSNQTSMFITIPNNNSKTSFVKNFIFEVPIKTIFHQIAEQNKKLIYIKTFDLVQSQMLFMSDKSNYLKAEDKQSVHYALSNKFNIQDGAYFPNLKYTFYKIGLFPSNLQIIYYYKNNRLGIPWLSVFLISFIVINTLFLFYLNFYWNIIKSKENDSKENDSNATNHHSAQSTLNLTNLIFLPFNIIKLLSRLRNNRLIQSYSNKPHVIPQEVYDKAATSNSQTDLKELVDSLNEPYPTQEKTPLPIDATDDDEATTTEQTEPYPTADESMPLQEEMPAVELTADSSAIEIDNLPNQQVALQDDALQSSLNEAQEEILLAQSTSTPLTEETGQLNKDENNSLTINEAEMPFDLSANDPLPPQSTKNHIVSDQEEKEERKPLSEQLMEERPNKTNETAVSENNEDQHNVSDTLPDLSDFTLQEIKTLESERINIDIESELPEIPSPQDIENGDEATTTAIHTDDARQQVSETASNQDNEDQHNVSDTLPDLSDFTLQEIKTLESERINIDIENELPEIPSPQDIENGDDNSSNYHLEEDTTVTNLADNDNNPEIKIPADEVYLNGDTNGHDEISTNNTNTNINTNSIIPHDEDINLTAKLSQISKILANNLQAFDENKNNIDKVLNIIGDLPIKHMIVFARNKHDGSFYPYQSHQVTAETLNKFIMPQNSKLLNQYLVKGKAVVLKNQDGNAKFFEKYLGEVEKQNCSHILMVPIIQENNVVKFIIGII